MNERRTNLGWVAAAALLLAAGSARATVVAQMDLETMARRAPLIVRGTAESSESQWVDGKIQTVNRIRVGSCIKGQAPAVVEVRTPGGTVGDITQSVSGAPQFAPGEEVIVFLEKLPGRAPRYRVTGFSQGKFELVKGPAGRALVTQRNDGLAVKGPDGKVRPAAKLEPVPENDFIERVRRAAHDKADP